SLRAMNEGRRGPSGGGVEWNLTVASSAGSESGTLRLPLGVEGVRPALTGDPGSLELGKLSSLAKEPERSDTIPLARSEARNSLAFSKRSSRSRARARARTWATGSGTAGL